MADVVTVVSALVVAVTFLILAWFIVRLGVMEGQAVVRPVGAPLRTIPVQQMVGVTNPFQLHYANFEVGSQSQSDTLSSMSRKETIKVLLTLCTPCYVTPYWGLKKDALTAATQESQRTTDDPSRATDNRSDASEDDSENSSLWDENDSLNPTPVEHLFQGSYLTRGSSEFQDPTSECQISLEIPEEFDPNLPNQFPLVLSLETSRIDREQLNNPSQIVSLITALNITPSTRKCQVVEQCVQTADNRIFSVKKLFVSENDFSSEEISPPEGHSFQRQQRTDFTNSTCVICQSNPVTRALLPCRHACVCGGCFSRLNGCPLCREIIQSYFKVQDEPFPQHVDPEASEQLNRMSVWEITRGIFDAR